MKIHCYDCYFKWMLTYFTFYFIKERSQYEKKDKEKKTKYIYLNRVE